MSSATLVRTALCMCAIFSVAHSRQVVYLSHNNAPSLLYINSAHGTTEITDATDRTSEIVELILHPVSQKDEIKKATAVLSGDVQGIITFTQGDLPTGATNITGTITGLTPGHHGFHIHESGDLSGGCKSAGGHYNPYMKNHGSPHHRERHVGDLGNIFADDAGQAVINISDPVISLVGPRSIIGRSLMIHAGRDDLGDGGNPDSLKTGNAGGRVGCAVIGVALK